MWSMAFGTKQKPYKKTIFSIVQSPKAGMAEMVRYKVKKATLFEAMKPKLPMIASMRYANLDLIAMARYLG
jgi:tRNA A37 threonylcarbamoyladenosine dehydratase